MIFEIWIFKLSNIDQGIHKMPIKRNKSFQRFLTKNFEQKGKKISISVFRTTLRTQKKLILHAKKIHFFLENVCLSSKFD